MVKWLPSKSKRASALLHRCAVASSTKCITPRPIGVGPVRRPRWPPSARNKPASRPSALKRPAASGKRSPSTPLCPAGFRLASDCGGRFIRPLRVQRLAMEKERKAKEKKEALEKQKAETARRIAYLQKFGP